MKKLIILLIVAGVVAFLWWSFKPSIEIVPAGSENKAETSAPAAPVAGGSKPAAKAPAVVIYQNNAFNPAELHVKVGDKVVFTNKHVAPIRLASAPHPIHTSFPEFDSDTLAPGESYEFTFTKSMTLNYHNHFNPGVTGKIIVE